MGADPPRLILRTCAASQSISISSQRSTEAGDAGAGDLGEAFGNLLPPIAGGEGLRDHRAYAEPAEPDHRREVGMAVAEILGADDDITGLDLLGEAGVEAAHGAGGERIRVGEADVLDAHDLIDVEVRLLEDEGHPAPQRIEAHAPASAASAR